MAYVHNSYNITANIPEFYIQNKIPSDRAAENLNGKIDITITAIDDLYIGNGFVERDNNNIYKDTLMSMNRFVIPGSSLKGAVRHIATIVSNGCLKNPEILYKREKRNYYFDMDLIRCSIYNRCIICDMFGMNGKKSKIMFGDFISQNAVCKIKTLNSQFSPKINDPNYHDNGAVYGYKVYFNKCENYDSFQKDTVKIVKRGAVFNGSIFFENLTYKELCLLCYALGFSERINIKIGGYKNEGLGQVRIRGVLSGIDGKNVKELAEEYKNSTTGDVRESIADLEKYIAPYEKGEEY